MARISRLLVVLALLGSFSEVRAQNQSLTLNAAPPGGFISVSVQAQSPFGASAPCYWVIARFPVGQSAPSAPACTPPTVGTTVFVSWNAVNGATSYDLLRTNSPILPPAGIASPVGVAMAFAGTSFGDNSVGMPGFNYTIVTASAAQAVFLLDNQNQSTPQVRLTVSNATGTTSSFLIAGVPANIVAGPATSSNNFVPTWVGTSGTQLGTGFLVTGNCGSGNQIPLTGGALGNPTSVLNQTCIPAVRTNAGTTYTQVTQSEIFICTAACTVTPIAPAAGNRGQQFCVQNDDNVASIITLAAIPGVAYENTARTSYKAANTTLASAGAIADQICIVARDSAHYNVFSFVGTWN